MTTQKARIRIIKRGQEVRPVEKPATPEMETTTHATSVRELKATVTGWVREFQQKSQTTHPRYAFALLFK